MSAVESLNISSIQYSLISPIVRVMKTAHAIAHDGAIPNINILNNSTNIIADTPACKIKSFRNEPNVLFTQLNMFLKKFFVFIYNSFKSFQVVLIFIQYSPYHYISSAPS